MELQKAGLLYLVRKSALKKQPKEEHKLTSVTITVVETLKKASIHLPKIQVKRNPD